MTPKSCPECFAPGVPIVVLDTERNPRGLKCRHCEARFTTPDAVRIAQQMLREAPPELTTRNGNGAHASRSEPLTWQGSREATIRKGVDMLERELYETFAARGQRFTFSSEADRVAWRQGQWDELAAAFDQPRTATAEHSANYGRRAGDRPIEVVVNVAMPKQDPTPVTIQNTVNVPASKPKKIKGPNGTYTIEDA